MNLRRSYFFDEDGIIDSCEQKGYENITKKKKIIENKIKLDVKNSLFYKIIIIIK